MRHPFLVTAAVLILVVAVFACHPAKRTRGDGLTNVESKAAETPTPPPPEAEETATGSAPAGVGGESRLVLDSAGLALAMPGQPGPVVEELVVIEAEESLALNQPVLEMARKLRRVGRAQPIPARFSAPPPPDPQPGLLARDLEGGELGAFPLRRTSVTAEISGPLGRTRVRQEYGNPYGEVIEAVYVFPLPSMAAVTDFVLEAGGRRIVGLVRPREEAERIYRQARARGQTASLLTQERPNIFTQSVANVEPGGEVTVELTFFERLNYEDGHFEWVFPTVVGPRYIPGSPRPAPASAGGGAEEGEVEAGGAGQVPAGGTSPPTDQVPDAHRITPPVLRPDEASGHRLDLTVTVEAPVPIRWLEVPSHQVTIDRQSSTRRTVRLARDDGAVLDRDFVLRFGLAGEDTELGLLAHRQGSDGYFLLGVQPPVDPADELVMWREISFILDISGSMSGKPLDLAREVIDLALGHLRPDDRFNLYVFASGSGQLWPEARAGSAENLAAARRFLDRQQGGGGTEMLAGVARALRGSHDPASLQMFVFLTDGFVGNEGEILRLIREERGTARFFAFGIGSSVNRYLIEGIGEHGGGSSHVVLPREGEVEKAARRLVTVIDSPVLVDVEIDWQGLPVEEVYPGHLPDLYGGGTVELVGRYTRPARGTVVVSGRRGTRRVSYELEVDLPALEPAHAVLGPVWARHKIHHLSGRMLTADGDQRPRLVQAITDLALEHRLASAYTAFVAVDESRVVGDGRPLRVLQPVALPEGVSYEGVFGEQPAGAAVSVTAWGMVLQQGAGGIGVVQLEPEGEAAQSGVRPGGRVVAVDGVLVRDLRHLQSLLLQVGGPTVEVRFDPGGEVRLTTP